MADKQSYMQRQSSPDTGISPPSPHIATNYAIPESIQVMRYAAAGGTSPITIPAMRHLQATLGNQAVQRLLQRAPGDPTAAPTAEQAPQAETPDAQAPQTDTTEAPTDTPVDDAAMAMIDYSMVADHIAEVFAEYDAMVIQVPDNTGGQAPIHISLAYFMNAYEEDDKASYKALAEKSVRTEEEEKIFLNLQARKNRHEIHKKAYNALGKPLKAAQPGEYNAIMKSVKFGKGSAAHYQMFIQTAVNKAAALKAEGKTDEEIAGRVLPIPGEDVAAWQTNVQNWVDTHYLGVDCSALVKNVLISVAAQFNLKRVGERKQEKVANLADLRAGDVTIGPGHIRMVQKVELVADAEDPSVNWLAVTLIESGSAVGGANTRYLRFPTLHKGKDVLRMDIDSAIPLMQETNASGEWVRAAAERKKYTFYRRLLDKSK